MTRTSAPRRFANPPMEGAALPRTHNHMKGKTYYKPEPHHVHRPNAEAHKQVRSVGMPT
jgi:hypothetical protein